MSGIPWLRTDIREQDLESFAWDKNEQNTQPSINQQSHSQYHHSALRKHAADIGFSNAREVEGCVLAVSDKCQDWVQRVLIRRQEVNANSKWKNELKGGR